MIIAQLMHCGYDVIRLCFDLETELGNKIYYCVQKSKANVEVKTIAFRSTKSSSVHRGGVGGGTVARESTKRSASK